MNFFENNSIFSQKSQFHRYFADDLSDFSRNCQFLSEIPPISTRFPPFFQFLTVWEMLEDLKSDLQLELILEHRRIVEHIDPDDVHARRHVD